MVPMKGQCSSLLAEHSGTNQYQQTKIVIFLIINFHGTKYPSLEKWRSWSLPHHAYRYRQVHWYKTMTRWLPCSWQWGRLTELNAIKSIISWSYFVFKHCYNNSAATSFLRWSEGRSIKWDFWQVLGIFVLLCHLKLLQIKFSSNMHNVCRL